MGGAAKAEKPRLVPIGALGKIAHFRKARPFQPRSDIRPQCEQALVRRRRGLETAGAERVLFQEMGLEIRAHLIAGLGNTGTYGAAYGVPFGAKVEHGLQDRLADARQRAFPPGMGCANDPRLRVGEQDWRAIRAQDRKPDGGQGRRQAVGGQAQ